MATKSAKTATRKRSNQNAIVVVNGGLSAGRSLHLEFGTLDRKGKLEFGSEATVYFDRWGWVDGMLGSRNGGPRVQVGGLSAHDTAFARRRILAWNVACDFADELEAENKKMEERTLKTIAKDEQQRSYPLALAFKLLYNRAGWTPSFVSDDGLAIHFRNQLV